MTVCGSTSAGGSRTLPIVKCTGPHATPSSDVLGPRSCRQGSSHTLGNGVDPPAELRQGRGWGLSSEIGW